MNNRIGQPGRRAFTLVEMIVVMGLIAMLAGILLVALMTARRASIRLECQSKLSQIGRLMHQASLDRGGLYPMLAQTPDADGRYASLTPPIDWDQHKDGVPWWARVYQETQGASIDADSSTPGIQPPEQLPITMQLFHCRMAPALDFSGATAEDRLANLNGTLSYGLNFDMKRADAEGTPYKCFNDSSDLEIGPRNGESRDKDPDQFSYTEMANPSEFILLAESNAGEVDAGGAEGIDDADRTGWRIAAHKVSELGEDNALHPAPATGRHGHKGNVLFGDLHVELLWAEEGTGELESANVNLDTRLWTLPND